MIMSDNERLIKRCESEIKSLQDIINEVDRLDVNSLDDDTRENMMIINESVKQSCTDRINTFNLLITELKRSNGDV